MKTISVTSFVCIGWKDADIIFNMYSEDAKKYEVRFPIGLAQSHFSYEIGAIRDGNWGGAKIKNTSKGIKWIWNKHKNKGTLEVNNIREI